MNSIKFSGLKGQALVVKDKDIPSIKEFQDVIPDHFFTCDNNFIKVSFTINSDSVICSCNRVIYSIYSKNDSNLDLYSLISGTLNGFWVLPMNVDMEHS